MMAYMRTGVPPSFQELEININETNSYFIPKRHILKKKRVLQDTIDENK